LTKRATGSNVADLRWWPMSANANEPDCSASGRTRPVPPCGVQRRDRAKARPHQPTRRRAAVQWKRMLQQFGDFLRDETCVPVVTRVLGEAVRRLGECGDQWRNLQPVDQVVEHDLQVRIAQVVESVVHDQQRVVTAAAEPRRDVDADAALVPSACCAPSLPRPCRRAPVRRRASIRTRVAVALRDRVGANGSAAVSGFSGSRIHCSCRRGRPRTCTRSGVLRQLDAQHQRSVSPTRSKGCDAGSPWIHRRRFTASASLDRRT